MPIIANPYAKQYRLGLQTDAVTIAPTNAGRVIRRVQAGVAAEFERIASEEKSRTYQKRPDAQGGLTIPGNISGELIPGQYDWAFETLLRRAWTAGPTTGALITIATTISGNNVTFTRSAGSFLTDGFYIGMGIRVTGYTAPAADNNNRNLQVSAVAALTMTATTMDGRPYIAKAAGDSMTIVAPGKYTFIPDTGHIERYFTLEEWQADIPLSSVYTGMRPRSLSLTIPGSGRVGIEIPMQGLRYVNDVAIPTNAQYFVTPADNPNVESSVSTGGNLFFNGEAVPLLTNFEMTIDGALGTTPVAFTQYSPYLNYAAMGVSGTFTPLVSDQMALYQALNRDSTAASIAFAMTSGRDANAAFVTVSLPRIRVWGEGPASERETDSTIGIAFMAEEHTAGGVGQPHPRTTILVQDSTLV